jgi:ribosomal protein L20A (L18A)
MAKYKIITSALGQRFSSTVDAFNKEDATDKIKKLWLQKLHIESVEPFPVEPLQDKEIKDFLTGFKGKKK